MILFCASLTLSPGHELVPVPVLPVSHGQAFFALVIGFRCVNGTERNNKKQISKKLPIFFSCDSVVDLFSVFFLGNCPEKVGVCCVGGRRKKFDKLAGSNFSLGRNNARTS